MYRRTRENVWIDNMNNADVGAESVSGYFGMKREIQQL
jgi:hypothetical protein